MLPIGWRAVGSAVGLGLLILNPWGRRPSPRRSRIWWSRRSAIRPRPRGPGTALPLTSVVTNASRARRGGRHVDDQVLPGGGLDQEEPEGASRRSPSWRPARRDGAAVALSVYSDTNPGTYSVQACADADEVVTEVSETNNCTTAVGAITILESPDLVVTSINNPTSSAGQGQPIAVKSTVKNIGPVERRSDDHEVLPRSRRPTAPRMT